MHPKWFSVVSRTDKPARKQQLSSPLLCAYVSLLLSRVRTFMKAAHDAGSAVSSTVPSTNTTRMSLSVWYVFWLTPQHLHHPTTHTHTHVHVATSACVHPFACHCALCCKPAVCAAPCSVYPVAAAAFAAVRAL